MGPVGNDNILEYQLLYRYLISFGALLFIEQAPVGSDKGNVAYFLLVTGDASWIK